MNTFSDDLQKIGVIKQIGSTPDEKPNKETTFLNPMNIIKKNDSIKFLLDARHLNSTSDQLSESWPLEHLAAQLARANKNNESAIDLLYAYAKATTHDEAIKVAGFSSADQPFISSKHFVALKVFQMFSHNKCLSFSKTWFVNDLNWFILMLFY